MAAEVLSECTRVRIPPTSEKRALITLIFRGKDIVCVCGFFAKSDREETRRRFVLHDVFSSASRAKQEL